MADHSWLGPVVSRSLQAVVRRDPLESCSICDGTGVYTDVYYDDHDCPCGEDGYDTPTPADLLTDPRVRALFEALDEARAYLYEGAPDRLYDAAKAALAPFKEVDHG